MSGTPQNVATRLDAPMLEAVEAFALANGVNKSEALRVLVQLGLRQASAADGFLAGYREGFRLGTLQFSSMLGTLYKAGGDFLRLANESVMSAASMRCVPVPTVYPPAG